MGLCVCVEPKLPHEEAQGFLNSSLVWCFLYCHFLLDVFGSIETEPCALVSQREMALRGIPFLYRKQQQQ